jgi:uncharacterized tellurite resistance protein B-like protein
MPYHKEDLYDAFGELLYAICQIDGEVQEAEALKIEELLNGQAGAAEIQWSFKYEFDKKQTVQEAYSKAIDICQQYGAAPEYDFLFDTLEKVAAASNGISTEERELIQRFKSELMAYFQKNARFEE